MKRFAGVFAAILFAAAMSGCNTMGRQPKLENAAINPVALKPGDNAAITVKVVDKHKIVQRVVATVVEDQRMKFALRDNGISPDEKAGDGVWSYSVRVPFMAPPGNFTLEITAYNEKGDAINVKKGQKEIGPLTATCTWSITYPPEGAPAEASAEGSQSAAAPAPAPAEPAPAAAK
ncbi:MAG: hypothetical protein IT366_12100 [Candidatus Hydrogenedentes bacterium]|nr:hypothetical protein [Candidatus Hydrogenedentota bacterium]